MPGSATPGLGPFSQLSLGGGGPMDPHRIEPLLDCHAWPRPSFPSPAS